MALMTEPAAMTYVLLEEYSLADAIRASGFTEASIKTWMVNGTLREGEWRLVPDANGAGRDGYLLRRAALERIAAKKGRRCAWGQARAGQIPPEVAAHYAQMEEELVALRAKLARAEARAEARAAQPRRRYAAVPAADVGLPDRGPLPAALVTVSTYARRHGFEGEETEQAWRKALAAGAFRAVTGQWDHIGGRMARHALDAEGRRTFVAWGRSESAWAKYYRDCGEPSCECAGPAEE